MRKVMVLIIATLIECGGISVDARELKHSGRTEVWGNPFIAYGYSPNTKLTTGYLAALRIAPGRTDECKLIFSGVADKTNEFSVRYLRQEKLSGKRIQPHDHVSLVDEKGARYFIFSKKNLAGDCDWILPFVVESDPSENPGEVRVAIEAQHAGDWISVYVIEAQKARFHGRPNSSSVKKDFLVKGDVIYVYDEQPEWYFVRYEEGKRKIEGWIRKSDTVQI